MYIASVGQEACVIMDVFSYIAFSNAFHIFLGFSSTARMFVQ